LTHPDLEAAWDQLHATLPPGWVVGRPMYHDERRTWEQYAYDPAERPKVGKRSREWTAIAPAEVECVLEMARCLVELRAGRWPE